jgi:hypothetical protein
MPFDSYPGGGKELLGKLRGSDGTSRRGYGLDFQRRTGQSSCAYCGSNLVENYVHWLLMSIDHVVPTLELLIRPRLRTLPERKTEHGGV